ncbi:hypothetical protein HGP17_23860 [Rhizobium sp. P38BS-XIX]|uniref:hypothetical protein n=1 Tax=Rhizobium sp. P38BS-XIX TaxID=2726740 RepID=UPI001456CA2F|nr:hypothetical protein [Rhizobium sp. P38BS-XIX]NLR99869.1 hypothetical protein [Rhizobium sp. P38BS-XIX]
MPTRTEHEIQADLPTATEEFGIQYGAPVFHSVMVHLEGFLAIQFEERFVHPKADPEYNRFYKRSLVNDISASIVRFVSPASRFHLDAGQSFGL